MAKLTAKEEEIMGFFWEKGPLFVREIVALYSEPRPHFNTLSTMVRSLQEKGFLSYQAYGNTYQYYPVISKEEFNNKSLKDVIGKYYNSSVFSAVSSLVEQEAISVEELKRLINLVEKGK